MTLARRLGIYHQTGRDSAHQLVEQHAPLVKKIALHLMARLPDSVQLDDLVQAGMVGLLEAAAKYQSDRGASFETYAGIRIRGAIVDEIRKGDWVPRSVHRNARRVSAAIKAVEDREGREAQDQEVAQELGMSLSEYHSCLSDASSGRLFPSMSSMKPASCRYRNRKVRIIRWMMCPARHSGITWRPPSMTCQNGKSWYSACITRKS